MTCPGCNCTNCDAARREAARAVGDIPYSEAKHMYAAQAVVRGEPADQDPYYTGRAREFLAHVYPTADVDFVFSVLAEVKKARAKFGEQPSTITGLALGEESGEAQRALLHIYEGKGGEDPLYLECFQTAAMALRLATEWKDRQGWPGNAKRGCGGSYEVGSGGHVPGTPGEGCAACDRDFGAQIGVGEYPREGYTGDHMDAHDGGNGTVPAKFARRID